MRWYIPVHFYRQPSQIYKKNCPIFKNRFFYNMEIRENLPQTSTRSEDKAQNTTQRTFHRHRHGAKTNKAQNRRLKKISNTDSINIPKVNPGVHEGWAVPASYKIPAIVLISTSHVAHHYTQTSITIINKTWTLLKKLGVMAKRT